MEKVKKSSGHLRINTLLLLCVSIWHLVGCSGANDIAFSSYSKSNPKNNNGPSPSGLTVFQISSGSLNAIGTDSTTIQAHIYPMKKEKYIANDTSAQFTINAKRLKQ